MKMIKLTSMTWPTPAYVNIEMINSVFEVVTNIGKPDEEVIGTDIRIETSNIVESAEVLGSMFSDTKQIKLKNGNSGVSIYVKETLEEVMDLLSVAGVDIYELEEEKEDDTDNDVGLSSD